MSRRGGVECDNCKSSLKNSAISFGANFYHPNCFRCQQCKQTLSTQYSDHNGEVFCEKCYPRKASFVCYGCAQSTCNKETVRMLERQYHKECATCFWCKTALISEKSRSFYEFDNEPYCLQCCYAQAVNSTTGDASSVTVLTHNQSYSMSH